MQQMTRQDLTALLEQTSHALTVEDIDAIAELDAAADIVVNGARDNSSSLFDYPIIVKGHAFQSPTIGKQLYWQECVANEIDEVLMPLAFLWLLEHQEVPKERGNEIKRAVKKWARSCKLTEKDVQYVVDAYTSETNTGDGSTKARYGEVIALLCREYGESVEHWLNAPVSEIEMLVADWTRLQEAKAAAYRSSSAGRKNPLPPAPSPKIKALKRYRELKNALRDKWQQKK